VSSSTDIHPSAVVEDGAQLGEGVKIGPFCHVGSEVTVGDRCVLQSYVSLVGKTVVGSGNEFYPHAAVGGRSQDLKYTAEPTGLRIGDHNVFREFVTVNRATDPGNETVIGSHGNFLAYVHVAHDCVVGDHVIFSNNGTLAGHIHVEDYVILGGLTAVHQFCWLGAHCITGGCSKIVQDVVPYTIADGNPAEARGINRVGMERRDFSPEAVRAVHDAFKMLFREGLNTKQALEKLAGPAASQPAVARMLEFVASSERGVVK